MNCEIEGSYLTYQSRGIHCISSQHNICRQKSKVVQMLHRTYSLALSRSCMIGVIHAGSAASSWCSLPCSKHPTSTPREKPGFPALAPIDGSHRRSSPCPRHALIFIQIPVHILQVCIVLSKYGPTIHLPRILTGPMKHNFTLTSPEYFCVPCGCGMSFALDSSDGQHLECMVMPWTPIALPYLLSPSNQSMIQCNALETTL